MRKITDAVRGYPLVAVTLGAAVVGGLLHATGQGLAARWLISVLALMLAAWLTKGMIAALRQGTYGIDLLAVVAITATVVLGEYWAALIVCLMLTGGEALEDLAGASAQRELSALLANTPQQATRIGPNGDGERIDVEQVAVGDRIMVRAGELIPVDGVLETFATLDETSITGESLPVDHPCGSQVLSGAINVSQVLTMRASATAANSQYQRIIGLVKQAQASKAPFVRLADKVAVPFTIVALLIAGAAWLISGEAVRFAEVLVVATPCPLIIAAPVAFMGGMSRAAKLGIIVKDSGALEQMSRVRTAAFDKTGTLTAGVPRVKAVRTTNGFAPLALLAAAAAVESNSTHPLAVAIVKYAHATGIKVPQASNAMEVVGAGMQATVAGQTVRVGKPAFAGASGKELGVSVSIAGVFAGEILVKDEVRQEAYQTLVALRKNGIEHTILLTGDHETSARAISAELPIDEVQAGLLPADKVAAVRQISQRPVMMVGDGLNDAPVLAVADVGIAMGVRGSAAACESADVVIVSDDLFRVVQATEIGKRTMRIAWQAIAIGVAMSLGLMIIGATGVMPAVVGAWMQELVDVACIAWALVAMKPAKQQQPRPKSPQELPRVAAVAS